MNFIYKLLKQPFFGRFMVRWKNPLSSEEQKEWQTFTVKSPSGGKLSALAAPAKTSEAIGTIVLGHPMGKEAKAYFLKNGYASLYRECGLNVVVFDLNGFGQSSHGNFSFYWDIIAVGAEAALRFPGLPLGYHGVSMGAQWSIIAFTESHHYRFAILESAPTSLEEFWIRYPFAYKALKLFSMVVPAFAKKTKMIDRANELKNIENLLLIYSHKDEYAPVSMGERYLRAANVPSELFELSTAEHAKAMKSAEREVYESKLVEFVQKATQSASVNS